jgi:nicotinate-nucleotide pyrophosphorylase (carboxylating)
MDTDNNYLSALVASALAEDLGDRGDITTDLVVPKSLRAEAAVTARATGVVAGLAVARLVFEQMDRDLEPNSAFNDGDRVRPGDDVFTVSGKAGSIMTAERTALNFLGRLSGIATLTAAFVRRVTGTGTAILDTRKTTPGLRCLEKEAVRAGGGVNHRFGLFDQVLIKDNHIRAAGGVTEAVELARSGLKQSGIIIEVEVETLPDLRRAIAAGADRVLLDNMPLQRIRRAVETRDALAASGGRRVDLEVSGGVTLRRTADLARTGVDQISIGALTHSAPSLNFSMNVVRTWDEGR